MDQPAPEPKKIRAFIALKPPPQWDEALQDLQKKLKTNLSSDAIRWIPVEQIHLTLRFLGYITNPVAEKLRLILDKVAKSSPFFVLHFDGLGCFPRVKDPRIIWAGLKCDNTALAELHQNLTAATKDIGEPPEDRPFKPHLTLARVKNLEPKLIPKLQAALDTTGFNTPLNWTVNELILMQSQLSPKGARYEKFHVSQFPNELD
jgi:2'-5' RNA ligase